MRRSIPALLVVVLLVGCGAHENQANTAKVQIDERSITLPESKDAIPVYEVSLDEPLGDARVDSLRKVAGVEVVTQLTSKELAVDSGGKRVQLEVAAVEPILFRSVTPPTTRAADFVWISLILGRSAPTFDAAKKLGVEDGGSLTIGTTPFDIGAIADNGVPNFADVLVQNGAADELGLGPPRTLIVGAGTGASVDAIGKAIRDRLPNAKVHRLVEEEAAPVPEESAPTPMGQVTGGTIGTMTFQILKNGFIRPDPSWVEANIVQGEVPILGFVTCHRFLFPRLAGAMDQIEELGLADLINPRQYGGCYVPRFIDRDPSKPLSMHAFGLAVDLNVRDNPLGSAGNMDPRVVEVFDDWGFEWGGFWDRPDPMHFELR
jgi:hypothetical protein